MSQRPANLGIIWIAFLSATALYVAIVFLVDGAAAVDPELTKWVGIFGAVASFIHILIAFLLRPIITGLVNGNYQTYCIIRWALLESIAAYGLVYHFLGGQLMWTVPFFVVSLVTMALLPPTEADLDGFLSSH